MTIGEAFNVVREHRGLSQRGMARILDVSYVSIANWEGNKVMPNTRQMEQISTLFDVGFAFKNGSWDVTFYGKKRRS